MKVFKFFALTLVLFVLFTSCAKDIVPGTIRTEGGGRGFKRVWPLQKIDTLKMLFERPDTI